MEQQKQQSNNNMKINKIKINNTQKSVVPCCSMLFHVVAVVSKCLSKNGLSY